MADTDADPPRHALPDNAYDYPAGISTGTQATPIVLLRAIKSEETETAIGELASV
jgi:hypothetical protein